MRILRSLALLTVLIVPAAFAHSQVSVGIGIGPVVDYPAPVYVAGPPVCSWGYYSYYPYACAPYGYYGADWFFGGLFIGAGPWYSGWYGRPWGWGWGHPWGGWGWGSHRYYGGGYGYHGGGYGYHGGYNTGYNHGFNNGYRGSGAYGRSPLNGGNRSTGMNGYRGTYNGFNGSSGFRSGYNGSSGFHGYSGTSGFHGYNGGGASGFHGGGSSFHGGGFSGGGGGFHGGGGGGFHGGGGGGFHGGGGHR